MENWNFYEMEEMDAYNERNLPDSCKPHKTYTTELAVRVCIKISEDSRTLEAIYADNKDWFPSPSIILRWRALHPVFAKNLFAAKVYQTQSLVDDVVGIADDPANCEPEILAWSKERIKARQWLASKIIPKIYGDIKTIEQTTSENETLKAELVELRVKLAEQSKREY